MQFNICPESYERFMCLSDAIRLLLTDTKHTEKAGKYIERFLNMTASQYDEYCFTINVHFLSHLCWQVRNFGPLWSTPAFMFESANNMLSKPFTGTVNHLDFIIERYIRRKKLLLSELINDDLFDFAESLGCSTKLFAERKVIEETALPIRFDSRDPSLFSTMSLRTLNLDSLTYSKQPKGEASTPAAENTEESTAPVGSSAVACSQVVECGSQVECKSSGESESEDE